MKLIIHGWSGWRICLTRTQLAFEEMYTLKDKTGGIVHGTGTSWVYWYIQRIVPRQSEVGWQVPSESQSILADKIFREGFFLILMLCQIPSWIATSSPKWQTDSEQEGLFSETKQPSYEPDDSIENILWNYFDFFNNILQILLLNSRAISHFHNGHLLRQLNGHPICLWSYWTPSIPLFKKRFSASSGTQF